MPRGRPVSSMPNRQRTPGDVPGAPQYGQGRMMERAAKQLPDTPPRPPRPTQAEMRRPSPVPLGAPTAFPDEPVTAGAPFGAGAGPTNPLMQAAQDNRSLLPYLPTLEFMANDPEATDTVRGFVMYLKGLANDSVLG
jgi:hypothetical protein